MGNILAGRFEAARRVVLDFRDTFSRHFSLSIGGSMPGLFLKVPFTSVSAWVEWGKLNAGYGIVRASLTDIEFFLGSVRGVLSVEQKVERYEA
ncbi:hypothetical protein MRBLRH13_001466 [Agrobacterium radiobacter]|uniref:hypothetical protein n=1 Tax=Agrobacterium radiobacter TaxID=362 RepID=UPI00341384FD